MAALATYTFASTVRRGFQANADAMATVTVQVTGQVDYSRDVAMLTAGDVSGVPRGQVIRTWPRDGTVSVEPNYLALVEFDSPDLPWLFSRPAGPDGRVHPWLCLVVVDLTDAVADPLSPSPIGTKLTVGTDQLPDPAQAWLWAHAQFLGTDTVPDDPSRSLARLVCPRRLRPDRHYLACVVPTLAATRIAGLGSDPGDRRTSTDWAWDPAHPGDVDLPVFHAFRFSTGPSGDFEALVRRLHGVPLPPGLGRRRLRLDHPLSGLPAPAPAGADVELHVALRPPGERLDPIEPLVGPSYLDTLRSRLADAGYDVSLLTDAVDAPPPVVGPPVYGQLPVGRSATAAALGTPAVPPWLSELNLDPRLRVAAGLGAEVVRRDQDHLLEQAWRQVGDVLAANRLRRRAEFSMAAGRRLHARWIAKLDAGALLTSTAPVHAKIWVEPGRSLVGRLRDSPLPPAAVSVELRRFSRDRGTLAKAADWREGANVNALAARSAQTAPLLQPCRLDTIDVSAPPSAVWGESVAAEIVRRLVPDEQVPDDATAAQRLDAMARPIGVDAPRPDDAVARVADIAPEELLTRIGMLPVARVRRLVEEGPVHPGPIEPGPIEPGHFHPGPIDEGPIHEGPIHLQPGPIHVGPIHVGPIHHVPAGAGHWRFEPGDWQQVVGVNLGLLQQDTDLTLGVLKEQPGLIRRVGDRWTVDTGAIEAVASTGPGATVIDAPVFERLVRGTPDRLEVTPLDYAFSAPQRSAARTGLLDVVRELAELSVHGVDQVAVTTPLAGGLAGLRDLVVRSLDPRVTLPRAVNSRIAALLADEADHFDDIMVAPDLSEPTYGKLAAISHDWLLPGIDALPTDTTTLVAANREFIAGFLVGMNHELARELLWHEYPTDQRGTYTRQFWTRKITADRADRYDLRHELHRAPTLSLGALTGQDEDPLVLVVKGDLVRRYPSMLICAARTRAGQGGRRLLDPATVVDPDFVGLLDPDVLLVGFEALHESGVRAVADDPDQAWWFFFAEHFAEPRFGLDELVVDGVELGPDEHRDWTDPQRTWNDAAWQYATLDRGFLTAASFSQSLRKGTETGSPTKHSWGTDAAGQAWIALQFPFRRGVPAIGLLPPEEA